MCKYSRTLYNRQLIQFSRIPVEFVVRFFRYNNNNNNNNNNNLEVPHPQSGSSSTWFLVELTFGHVGFWGGRKTGVPGEKPLRAKERTNNKLNPHMAPTPGFEPVPHWWATSADTTAPSLALSKLRESNYIFHGCLVSAFSIFVQLMFTRSQSTMFRAVHSVHFITVSLG